MALTQVDLQDGEKLIFGTGNDLEIYHDGTDSFIDSNTGKLRVLSDQFRFNNAANDETLIHADANGAVSLYHNNVKRLETTASGVNIPGGQYLQIKHDTGKLTLGAGDDLEIYHNGTSSYIENNTSRLDIMSGTGIGLWNADASEAYIKADENGAVELYYDNAKKLETSSGGISVTGGINLTTNLSLLDNGIAKFGTGDDLKIFHDGSNTYFKNHTVGSVYHRARTNWSVQTNATDAGADDAIKALQNGAVELYYDNSKKLRTYAGGVLCEEELNVQSDLYIANDNKKLILGAGDDLQIYHDASNSYITNTTGNLILKDTTGQIFLQSTVVNIESEDGETQAKFTADGAVELYYDNAKKLETSSAGGTLHGTWAGINIWADQWRLTTTAHTSQAPIDSNWERSDTSSNGFANGLPVGTGMSQSSGVFTFPKTGRWLIRFYATTRQSDENDYMEAQIRVTGNNGSNWSAAAVGHNAHHNGGGYVYITGSSEAIMDVTDLSNDKCAFYMYFETSTNGYIVGDSTYNYTYVTFMRLGDT